MSIRRPHCLSRWLGHVNILYQKMRSWSVLPSKNVMVPLQFYNLAFRGHAAIYANYCQGCVAHKCPWGHVRFYIRWAGEYLLGGFLTTRPNGHLCHSWSQSWGLQIVRIQRACIDRSLVDSPNAPKKQVSVAVLWRRCCGLGNLRILSMVNS